MCTEIRTRPVVIRKASTYGILARLNEDFNATVLTEDYEAQSPSESLRRKLVSANREYDGNHLELELTDSELDALYDYTISRKFWIF